MFLLFIMHFLTYVFIPGGGDLDTAVAAALRPFSEDFPVKPWKRHLGPRETEAMARHYRLPAAATHKLAQHMRDWCRAQGGADEKGLFALMTCNPEARFDWYEIGGRWKGKLTNNVAACRDLLRRKDLADLLPHDFLTPDGVWHAKVRFAPGDHFDGLIVEKSRSTWLKEFRSALTRQKEAVVVCVDRHQ
jgi:hypothetical protein